MSDKNYLNPWYPRGEKEDDAVKKDLFFRIHFKKELMGSGTSRSIVFVSSYNKAKEIVDKLCQQGTTITGVIRFELPEDVCYYDAIKEYSSTHFKDIYDEYNEELFPEKKLTTDATIKKRSLDTEDILDAGANISIKV